MTYGSRYARWTVACAGIGWSIMGSTAIPGVRTAGDGALTSSVARGTQIIVSGVRCGRRVSLDWRTADRSLSAREELTGEGGNWSRYRLARGNLGAAFEAVRVADRIELISRSGDGKAEQRRTFEKVRGGVLVGPSLAWYLRDNLERLRAGTTLELEFLAVDRGLMIGLRAKPVERGADGSLRVRLEASSPLMRPFVPTTTLTFDRGGRVTNLIGIVPLQAGTGRQPISLEGNVNFGVEVEDDSPETCRELQSAR